MSRFFWAAADAELQFAAGDDGLINEAGRDTARVVGGRRRVLEVAGDRVGVGLRLDQVAPGRLDVRGGLAERRAVFGGQSLEVGQGVRLSARTRQRVRRDRQGWELGIDAVDGGAPPRSSARQQDRGASDPGSRGEISRSSLPLRGQLATGTRHWLCPRRGHDLVILEGCVCSGRFRMRSLPGDGPALRPACRASERA